MTTEQEIAALRDVAEAAEAYCLQLVSPLPNSGAERAALEKVSKKLGALATVRAAEAAARIKADREMAMSDKPNMALPPLHDADAELLRRVDRMLAMLPGRPAAVRGLQFDVRWRLDHVHGADATVTSMASEK